MFYSDKLDENVYSDLMEQIKKVNLDWLDLRTSRQYKLGLVFNEVTTDISHLNLCALAKSIKRWTRGAKSKRIQSKEKQRLKFETKPNYFSHERIAIYTAVFGPYDQVPEPYCKPDNCDFFIFTDQKDSIRDSVWNKIESPDEIKGYSNAQKNRYLKMHPHELFSEYKYSIYIDGNVQIVTDLTEYINILGSSGLGTHLHDSRNCIFLELETIIATGRENRENAKKHLLYIKESGIPEAYGLLQCNVIVREHDNPICVSIMENWWNEYQTYTKRDQISLPHVLYLKGIKIDEVGVLGNNIYRNPSFRVLNHSI